MKTVQSIPGLSLLEAPRLSALTTLGLGGSAVALLQVSLADALEKVPDFMRAYAGKLVVLGRGSNILVTDDGPLPLLLLRPDLGPEPEICGEAQGKTLLRAGAGVPLPRFLKQAADMGLAGLAGLAGIPGSLGGAVAMNAGSYGAEIGAVLHSVSAFTPEQGFCSFEREALVAAGLGYRHFALPLAAGQRTPDWFVITEAVFALEKDKPETIKADMRACLACKKSTQPVRARSAGCVFKNPAAGLSAGKLLDEAGFKGKRCGGMAFSELHANFLLNIGEGRAAEAMQLIAEARQAVRERFGYNLELEVKVWP